MSNCWNFQFSTPSSGHGWFIYHLVTSAQRAKRSRHCIDCTVGQNAFEHLSDGFTLVISQGWLSLESCRVNMGRKKELIKNLCFDLVLKKSEFSLDWCVTITSFVVSVNTAVTMWQLFCVKSRKSLKLTLLVYYSKRLAFSCGPMSREFKKKRLASHIR